VVMLKVVIGEMKELKMTHLHLHLTDDEGWRLEIPTIPELTQIGAYRCLDSGDCLEPQYGSGAERDANPANGFISATEYADLLAFAEDNKVSIITEINGPGHARAAIKSTESRGDNKYKMYDPNHANTIQSVQYFTDNVVNPCMESTFTFYATVIDYLKGVHAKHVTNGYHDIIHIGGDEVPHDADGNFVWSTSPLCTTFIENNNKIYKGDKDVAWKTDPLDAKDLFAYYSYRLVQIVDEAGFKVAGWEEPWTMVTAKGDKVVRPKSEFLADTNKDIYAFNWNLDLASGAKDWTYQLPNGGYKTVLTPASHLYLDHPEEPDSNERGYYWATRYTDMRNIFSFQPFNLYNNTAYSPNWGSEPGTEIQPGQKCEQFPEACVNLENESNIVGLQCSFWSETLMNDEEALIAIFPRLYACAERAYNPRPVFKSQYDETFASEFGTFLAKLPDVISRLESKNIRFNVPPPGVDCSTEPCSTNTIIPNMEVIKVGERAFQTKDKNGHVSRVVEVAESSAATAAVGVLTIMLGLICLL